MNKTEEGYVESRAFELMRDLGEGVYGYTNVTEALSCLPSETRFNLAEEMIRGNDSAIGLTLRQAVWSHAFESQREAVISSLRCSTCED